MAISDINTDYNSGSAQAGTVNRRSTGNTYEAQKTGNDFRSTIDQALAQEIAETMVDKRKRAPYAYLADENGRIHYKDVVFVCDDFHRTLNLGDVGDPKKTIKIPLESGGCLVVNRECLGVLKEALSMFSPEDQRRILVALRQEMMCAGKLGELEELKGGVKGESDKKQ